VRLLRFGRDAGRHPRHRAEEPRHRQVSRTVLALSQIKAPVSTGAFLFPLPLWERVPSEARAGEGSVTAERTPHPSRTASAPPSPTRGEGRGSWALFSSNCTAIDVIR